MNTASDARDDAGRLVDVGEVRLHVVEHGPRDGEPLVLVHGFPEFWYGWRHQLEPLAAAGFRVIVPDLRGYNRSDAPRPVGAYALHRLAGDVLGLLDALGIERAHLAAHDWGGVLGWWLAATAPERFRRVAILNAPHPAVYRRALRTDAAQRRRSWYVFFFQLPWLPEWWFRRRDFAVGLRSLMAGSRARLDADEIARYRAAWARPGVLRGMINWYRAALRRRPEGRPEEPIRVPLLLVWGERDIFLGPTLAEPSVGRCAAGRLVRSPDTGHWLLREQPARVAGILTEFLREP